MNQRESHVPAESAALFQEGPFSSEPPERPTLAPWKVLVVDDDRGIHDVTRIALKRTQFQDRPLTFLHAYSAAEALEILNTEDEVAVAFVDVVMETDDAGLRLVESIRKELKNPFIRLILRTGQPGAAPEAQVIEQYDINDYKDKTELTKQKLSTALFSALRSYRDIMALEQSRAGLQIVVESTAHIYKIQDITPFVEGLLRQVMSVVGLCGDSFVVESSGFITGNWTTEQEDQCLLAGSGIYQGMESRPLYEVADVQIREKLEQAKQARANQYYQDDSVFYFENSNESYGLIYLSDSCISDPTHRNLVELFCKNVSIAFENVSLTQEIENTQTEIIYTLGTVAEFRSKETSEHVHRVAEYVEILAHHMGLPAQEVERVKMASPLHDIGKLAIPDAILHKPGKLTEEEFEVMKTHTTKGFEMLRHSQRPLLKTAAIIALSHQEKWDGSGYPESLKGEDIPLYGRLVAVADVFDALGSTRCYKKGWTLDKILEYFKEQSGRHFDPRLVQLLLDNLDEFLLVRERSGA